MKELSSLQKYNFLRLIPIQRSYICHQVTEARRFTKSNKPDIQSFVILRVLVSLWQNIQHLLFGGGKIWTPTCDSL